MEASKYKELNRKFKQMKRTENILMARASNVFTIDERTEIESDIDNLRVHIVNMKTSLNIL